MAAKEMKMSRRSQSATAHDSSGSCELLQRRSSSCDCHYAYDNCLATALATPEAETMEMTKADVEANDEERSNYELAATQASCWLRQLLCLAAVANDSEVEEDFSNGTDIETQTQLESLYSQFDGLSQDNRSKVPVQLQPSQLCQLRARQVALSACLAEARRLDRQRRIQVSADRLAIVERLRGCRERLDLVAKCAARLRRHRPRRWSSRSRQCQIDNNGEGDSAIDRDRRLVRDSAARARRNVDDLAAEAETATATLGRRGRRLLVDCADCLRCRADRLGRRGREEAVEEENQESQAEEANDDRLMTKVESRLTDLVSGRDRHFSLEPRRLRQTLHEFELAQLLLDCAKDCCTDECDTSQLDDANSDTGDPLDSDPDAESITSTSSASRSDQQTASKWLHRQQRLASLDAQLSVARESLTQLAALSRARQSLRSDLDLRTVRLRHLRELVDAGGGRFEPADFLAGDEAEATRPTTSELLATTSAKLEAMSRRVRGLTIQLTTDEDDGAKRRLLAEEALDRRCLEAADVARLVC